MIGVMLLILIWGLSQFMMHLLWKCVRSQSQNRHSTFESYAGPGEADFGRHGRLIVAFCMYIGLSAICVIILILLGSGLFHLLDQDRCSLHPSSSLVAQRERSRRSLSYRSSSDFWVTLVVYIPPSSAILKNEAKYQHPQSTSVVSQWLSLSL